ncbi:IucC family-domain-containing protein [Penicillium diatomitis]|uniref:IucC family-domain-containing protein n=1 Tax=Penicillium diatomitis TaxID=2819901 RepID=A0A9W9X464_9EURO|nr:IucC family-domain-containing protein [Penicillium diatomitis]KAJ5482899.1 IucC family-domain-containing protein [Penicillium diatomitis]
MSVILGDHLVSTGEITSPTSFLPHVNAVNAVEDLKAVSTTVEIGTEVSSDFLRRRAYWETTKRVLAQAVNEELVVGTLETTARSKWLLLRAPKPEAIAGYDGTWIKCGVRADAYVETDGARIFGFLRAEDLLTPVLLGRTAVEAVEELDPEVLCRIICSWQPELAQNGGGATLVGEIKNARDNQAPLKPVVPDDIPEMLSPELTFLSIPRSEMRVTGPFEQLLEPLLSSLEIPKAENPDRITVPCFTRQLPSILPLYPQARRLKSVPNCCRAQISMRSLSFNPETNFPHHIKMSLFVQITSGLRNVKPWGAVLGPVLGKLLPKLLPENVWMLEEPASVTGAQEDFKDAGQISAVIRTLPKQLADNPDEVLIPGAGLYQKPFNEDQTYMEILFGLDDLKKRQDWFRKYAALLFSALMPPLVRYGLGFESHLQNVLVRVNFKTKELTGFAIRDFEGTRIHYPTFLRSGYELNELPAGSPHLSDTARKPWNKVHHSIIQDNVSPILHILGLEAHGGWLIVREELERVLNPAEDPDARGLWEYFTQEKMSIPRFMGMRLIGRYVESHEIDVPNFVLRK